MVYPQQDKITNFYFLQLNNKSHFYNHKEFQKFLTDLTYNLIKHSLFLYHVDNQIIEIFN